jgi:hypothetical protein
VGLEHTKRNRVGTNRPRAFNFGLAQGSLARNLNRSIVRSNVHGCQDRDPTKDRWGI